MAKVTSTKRPNQVWDPCFLAQCPYPFLAWATDASSLPSRWHLLDSPGSLPGVTAVSFLSPSTTPPSHHNLHSNISLPVAPLSVFQTRFRSFRLALEDILYPSHYFRQKPRKPICSPPLPVSFPSNSSRPPASPLPPRAAGAQCWAPLSAPMALSYLAGLSAGCSHSAGLGTVRVEGGEPHLNYFCVTFLLGPMLSTHQTFNIRYSITVEWVNEVTVLFKNDSPSILTKLPPNCHSDRCLHCEGFSTERVSKISLPSKMLSKDGTHTPTLRRSQAKDLLQSHQGVPHKWRYRYLLPGITESREPALLSVTPHPQHTASTR